MTYSTAASAFAVTRHRYPLSGKTITVSELTHRDSGKSYRVLLYNNGHLHSIRAMMGGIILPYGRLGTALLSAVRAHISTHGDVRYDSPEEGAV